VRIGRAPSPAARALTRSELVSFGELGQSIVVSQQASSVLRRRGENYRVG